MAFQIPKPSSRPLNMHYTYQDAEELFERIVKAYITLGKDPADINWNVIRRASGDTVYTIVALLERDVEQAGL